MIVRRSIVVKLPEVDCDIVRLQALTNLAYRYRVGNLIGGVTYAFLFVAVYTQFWVGDGGSVGKLAMDIALRKTLGYASLGMLGWQAAMVSEVLCKWMVTLVAVMGFASTSLIGKTIVMWLPIFTFFTLGYEHSLHSEHFRNTCWDVLRSPHNYS